ncbi:MAG: aminotransferase class I/II-fold pyridoxal phosphate-dependent enzyme [Coriobacteriia bacterium]|nr:aminotransferase class I/II-fold pyridoxal phosphate-dependent enzyme [Coriobacteriia bacterium]
MRYDHGGAPQTSIDASVNVNPFGPPAALDAVFACARELAMCYPEIDAGSARQAWADRLDVPRERLLVGNGASELITLAMRALQPRRVVVFEPCYSEYVSAAEAVGAEISRLPLSLDATSWSTPLGEYEPLPSDLLVLGQPNNPTGHLMSPDEIAVLARRGVRVLVDESFLPFLARADEISMVMRETPGVFVVSSLTKIFCVPGLRLGLFVGDAETVRRMSELRDPWSVNGLAAGAAVVLAGEQDYLARTRSWLAEERPRMSRLLADIPGVSVCDGVAPFILAELPDGVSATDLCDSLAARGIGVRDASTFAGFGPRWLRVGVRSAAENAQVAVAIAEHCEVCAR